ncbi:MAG: putative aminohydrolase SsnA [Lachnospiraceae bacterium]
MLLIGNGPLITRDIEHPFYANGAVVIQDERILDAGSLEQMKRTYPIAEFHDAAGKLIMPGYLDTHEHIYSAFARGGAIAPVAPNGFLAILNEIWWKLDSHLLLEHTYYSAVMTYLECIRNGVTFVNDHHASYGQIRNSLFRIADAAALLNIRTCLAYEISDRNGIAARNEAITESMEFADYTCKNPSNMLSSMIGLHASFTLSDETLSICRRENTHNLGYHIHVAEGAEDEMDSQRRYHKSVTRRLVDEEILNSKSVAGHCIHISETDRKLLRDCGVMVVHNPESNMGNAVGTPNILKFFEEGILTGLGTDGYTHDMLESLKVAQILMKHDQHRSDIGFTEACRMLFLNNAVIAGTILQDKIGILKKGALADLILVDYTPATPLNEGNMDGHLMFGVQGSMTDTTMINGTFVMKNRKILTADETLLLSECRRSAEDLWRQLH